MTTYKNVNTSTLIRDFVVDSSLRWRETPATDIVRGHGIMWQQDVFFVEGARLSESISGCVELDIIPVYVDRPAMSILIDSESIERVLR